MTVDRKALEIFCDGGFGNRYNALISGLALAETFGLDVKVYWPKNGSCEAAFEDIFATKLSVSELTLPELAGTLDGALCLLHDTLGSDTLKVPFHSAYDFASVDVFAAEVLSRCDQIFYYPALIPAWIEQHSIQQAVGRLQIRNELVTAAKDFIRDNLPRPFYGLHLRRTDLNVGLSDAEVQLIVNQHANEIFFVCSDDPIAEAMAAVHPHVHRRIKTNHVGKRNPNGGWQSPTADDSGRMYYSNIQRGKEATLEGVIDLLILGQSTIVCFTGSTFQSVARLIGESTGLSGLEKPAPMAFSAVGDVIRMIKQRRLPLNQLIGLCEGLVSGDRVEAAMDLLLEALEHEVGMSRFVVMFNLGVYSTRVERYQQALIYLRAAMEISPDSTSAKEAYFKVAQLGLIRNFN